MTLWQEIREDLFGPSRAEWAKFRRALAAHMELRQICRDEKAAERLRHRGYIDDDGLLKLYRKMIDRVQNGSPQ